MQSTDELASATWQVHQRLLRAFGNPAKGPWQDAVGQLVSTILSQNTNDNLRDQAFQTLCLRFPTWEQVRDAPLDEVVDAIRIAGLSKQKAPHIQQALRRITAERGELSLDFLREMSVEQAKTWLTSSKGVGPKTAAIILLFSLDMPAFPVDTHIHRVTRRLGLIPSSTSREKAHEILESLVPAEAYFPFHINLIRHGREICQARRPRCDSCVLRDLCHDYQAGIKPEEAQHAHTAQ